MAPLSALVVASVLSATLVYAQQPAPATPAAPAVPQARVTPAQPQSAPDSPFQLPLIALPWNQRSIAIEVDDRTVPGQLSVRPLPQSTPAPCTTHKMPMAFANPNFDSKMVIKGTAPKPPCI